MHDTRAFFFSFLSQHMSRYRYGYRSPEQSESAHTTFVSCPGKTLRFSCGPLSASGKLMTKETAAQSPCGYQRKVTLVVVWSRLILVMI